MTCIIILFLLYPTLCQSAMSFFTCLRIPNNKNGKLYLLYDMEIECYGEDGTHMFMVAVVGIPMLLVYVVGLPLFALVLLARRRHHLGSPQMLFKYGML